MALLLGRVLARAHDEDGRERGEARRDVHDNPAREVPHAPVVEEAGRAPDPVREGAVDQDDPERDEDQVRRELGFGF